MATKYGTIITALGNAKIADCVIDGTKLNIMCAAAGDGGGAYYVPTTDQEGLINELWRGEIASAERSTTVANMIDVKFIIPAEVGNFTVREMGLFDSDGGLIAVCNTPDTEKVAISEGVSGKLTMVMHIIVADASVVEFTINPSLDTVSRQELEQAIREHSTNSNAHSEVISNAVSTAVTNLLASDDPDNPVAAAVESVIQEKIESGEVVSRDTVKNMINTADASGGTVGLASFDFAIPVSAWTADETATDSYVYYADIANDLVSLASHIPDVTLDKSSLDTARACGMAPSADILEDGKVRVYAQAVPAAEISGTCRLWAVSTGTGSDDDGEGGSENTMPVASTTTLGGVKIGDGINVSADGTITPDVLTNEEIDEIIGGS